MTLNLSVPESTELRPRIVVFGVGGAGGNAVNNMIEAKLEGVDFVVANTDAQALQRSSATKRVQMGASITEGLGAGARPEVGEQAAEDSIDEIREHLTGAHMVFITAGMGGGTGTGAAPVIARSAREMGILTVGVVTKPFHFEGSRRMKLAEDGVSELQDHVDTLIVIPNQNLFRIATEKTTFAEAFSMADQVLHSGVRGITDLMVMPGLINLDFADVRAVMNEMGKAMMGTGEAEGEKRAIEAAHAAISNPLLDDVSMKGATGVLINITGGYDMTLYEVDEAANEIRSEVDPDANIIVGSTFDEGMEGSMRVSVVATGIDAESMQQSDPRARSRTQTTVKAQAKDDPHAAILPWKRDNTDRPGRKMDTARSEPIVRRAHEAADRLVESPSEPEIDEEPVRQVANGDITTDAVSHDPVVSETTETDPYIAPASDEVAPSEPPQVRRDQERLAAEAARMGARPAPQQVEAREEKPKSGGFSLFGRRRKPVEPAPKSAPRHEPARDIRSDANRPQASAPTPSSAQPRATGDLFGDSLDDGDLEIPAFLRRQAN